MIKIQGTAVSRGIAIGIARIYEKQKIEIPVYQTEDTEKEIRRYQTAVHGLEKQYEMLYDKALSVTDEECAELFQSYQMLLTDVAFTEAVKQQIIENYKNAEAAVSAVCKVFTKMFEEMEDDYLRARALDIQSVSDQLINNLLGVENLQGTFFEQFSDSVILVADELTPDEMIRMNLNNVLGIVVRKGSMNSHTSIFARSIGIPMVIYQKIPQDIYGKKMVVDGVSGDIYIEPLQEILQRIQEKQQQFYQELEELVVYKEKETITKDGTKIGLYANVGSIADVEAAVRSSAEGIGLFRTEFLYLGRNDEPSEEEQFEIYRQAVEMMKGKKVIFRTADIGSDKLPDYLKFEEEINPVKGYHSNRIGLGRLEMLKRQLRAIYRASSYGNVSVMYPMITSADELEQLQILSKEVREELLEQGTSLGQVEEGIMIETPSAAQVSDQLAKMVDFFSIGTNDLTAFTLEMDRTNPKPNAHFDPHHEKVFQLIEMTVRSAHEAGIWIGICGELAADLDIIERLVRMGMDEFSVNPAMILPIRKRICSISQLTNESKMLYYHHKK